MKLISKFSLDWIEQCFTFPPGQRSSQQYQSTERTYSTQTNQTNSHKQLITNVIMIQFKKFSYYPA